MNSRNILASLALAASVSAVSTASAQVLDPANGHYYQVVSAQNSISWTNALMAAASLSFNGWHGHLATITSSAENSFLVTTFGGSLLSGKDIGGHQMGGSTEPGGGWGWITGEAFTYANWNIGEPNNGNGGPAENALQFSWNASNGVWNDISDTAVGAYYSGYVVEYEAVPEPACAALLGLGGALLLLRRRQR